LRRPRDISSEKNAASMTRELMARQKAPGALFTGQATTYRPEIPFSRSIIISFLTPRRDFATAICRINESVEPRHPRIRTNERLPAEELSVNPAGAKAAAAMTPTRSSASSLALWGSPL